MKKIKFITAINYVIVIIFMITITCYVINFSGNEISQDSTDWGVFGDFFGGVLNPVIAVLNVLVFIHLSRIISKLDEESKKQNLYHQKQLTLLQLKHNGLIDLIKSIDSLNSISFNADKDAYYKISILTTSIQSSFVSMSYLFNFLSDHKNFNEILRLLHEISSIVLKLNNTEYDPNRPQHFENYLALMRQFRDEKQKIIQKMLEEMDITLPL